MSKQVSVHEDGEVKGEFNGYAKLWQRVDYWIFNSLHLDKLLFQKTEKDPWDFNH